MILPILLPFLMTVGSRTIDREIMWVSLDGRVYEHLRLSQDPGGITADGLILRLDPSKSFRLRYSIRCDSLWQFRLLRLQDLDEPAHLLELQSDGKGNWSNGRNEAIPSLAGCKDLDIFYSPFTNTIAIRRISLKPKESAETAVAFVNVPDMTVSAVRQRYTFLQTTSSGGLYRYESLASAFTVDLPVDLDCLVIEYPGFFRRAWSLQ